MLPNHAPLVVAEAFGTLAELYPGASISASGGRPVPIRRPCARCATGPSEADFPARGERAAATAGAAGARAADRGDPGAGPGAHLAARLEPFRRAWLPSGLPYAFASHFAPRQLLPALELYRSLFRPSGVLAAPYAIIGVPVIAAPDDAEAHYLASSTYQRVLGILSGDRRCLPPPVEGFREQLHPQQRAAIDDFLAAAVIGGPDRVAAGFASLAEATGADEFMLVSDVFDPALRLRSLDIAARGA